MTQEKALARSPVGGEGGREAKIGRRAAVWADGRAIYLCFVPRSHFLAEEVLGLPLSVSGASSSKNLHMHGLASKEQF